MGKHLVINIAPRSSNQTSNPTKYPWKREIIGKSLGSKRNNSAQPL